MKIRILNYGVGNLFSVYKAFKKMVSGSVEIVRDRDGNVFKDVDIIILPGVGHFTPASSYILRYREDILNSVEKGVSIFGICLGMQLLGLNSEEGGGIGLNLIRGNTYRLPKSVKTPHMGWNTVNPTSHHKLFEDLEEPLYFYFAHSYYFVPYSREFIAGLTNYGVSFPSVVVRDLIVGVQFHPEKSGYVGMKFLRNYLEMVKK